MRQFFDTGSPLLNLLNAFSESLQTIPPDELLDKNSCEIVKVEGQAILMSAVEEAKRRKMIRDSQPKNLPRQ